MGGRAPRRAVTRPLPAPAVGVPGPFGAADRSFTEGVLTEAGFVEISFDEVVEPIRFGDEPDDAFSFVSTLGITRGLAQELDDARKAAALDALHATIVEHGTDAGVLFGGSAWLIRARAPGLGERRAGAATAHTGHSAGTPGPPPPLRQSARTPKAAVSGEGPLSRSADPGS